MCQVCSSLLFVLGIRDVGLAEAATIGFIGPILVTFLAIPLLGEKVDVRRWLALTAGMVGVLVVLRPGTGTFHPEGLYRVASAAFWAFGTILTRRMTATERPETTIFWSAVSGLVVLSAVIPFHFVPPTATQLWLSVAQGVLSSLGQWLVILSLRLAPVSTLAPLSYTQLLWMTLAGFLVFGALPDAWTLVGAAVIVASGLYTAWRERRGADRFADKAAFRQPSGNRLTRGSGRMMTIDSQVHAYERDHPGRPWAGHLAGPPQVTGDEMVAAMDAVGVDGALLVSPFSLYRYDASYALEVTRRIPTGSG